MLAIMRKFQNSTNKEICLTRLFNIINIFILVLQKKYVFDIEKTDGQHRNSKAVFPFVVYGKQCREQ